MLRETAQAYLGRFHDAPRAGYQFDVLAQVLDARGRPAEQTMKVVSGEENPVEFPLEWAPGAMEVVVTGPGGEPVDDRSMERQAGR